MARASGLAALSCLPDIRVPIETVAASTELVMRTSVILSAKATLPLSMVTIAPSQLSHCWVKLSNSSAASSGPDMATTPSATLITFAGPAEFHQVSAPRSPRCRIDAPTDRRSWPAWS